MSDTTRANRYLHKPRCVVCGHHHAPEGRRKPTRFAIRAERRGSHVALHQRARMGVAA